MPTGFINQAVSMTAEDGPASMDPHRQSHEYEQLRYNVTQTGDVHVPISPQAHVGYVDIVDYDSL